MDGSDGRRRKQVHHSCGYPLQSEMLSEFVPPDDSATVQEGSRVVVHYRSLNGVLTWVCSGCGKPLKVWWEGPLQG